MSELPKGWMAANLADLANINPRHVQGLKDNLAVTFTGMANISHESPNFRSTTEKRFAEVRTGFTHYAEGDVLFAKITPCMENGKGAVARNLKNGLGFGTTELHVVRPLGGISPYYLYRFMQQASFREAAKAAFTGSAGQARVPVEFMRSCQIPLPPLTEQERIVAKLEGLLARVSACRQRLDKIPKLLARFRQSVLAAACSGRLSNAGTDAVPNEWKTHRLDSLFAVRTGGTPSRKEPRFFVNGSIPWVKTGEVRNGEIFEAAEKITHDAIRNSNATVFPANTLLIAMYGEGKTRGQVGWLRIPAATNQACAALINEKMSENTREYIFYFLLSQYHKLRAESVGGNQPNLNLGAIKEWELALPPSDERAKIVLRVRHLLSFADRLEARVTTARKRVEALTQAILAKAFRGELVPTEAELAEAEGREYETASMLLERVMASANHRSGPLRAESAIRKIRAVRVHKVASKGKL